MILKASERGDAPQLARYLLASRENEHAELHEVRGFASDDLERDFSEADAIANRAYFLRAFLALVFEARPEASAPSQPMMMSDRAERP